MVIGLEEGCIQYRTDKLHIWLWVHSACVSLGLGKKNTLVRIKRKTAFLFKFNTDFLCKVTEQAHKNIWYVKCCPLMYAPQQYSISHFWRKKKNGRKWFCVGMCCGLEKGLQYKSILQDEKPCGCCFQTDSVQVPFSIPFINSNLHYL